MRRRRKRRYTWLPVLGGGVTTDPTSGYVDHAFDSLSFDTTLSVPIAVGGPQAAINISPLTYDFPEETPGPTGQGIQTPMADFLQSDYVLRRIVGKIHIAIERPPAVTLTERFLSATKVTCGFFIARAESSDVDSFGFPIGSSFVAPVDQPWFLNYNPDNPANAQEPWIWRRTWILGTPRQNVNNEPILTFSNEGAEFPSTNAGYGSVADGAHVDARTMRRVTSDDRLYFVQIVRRWPVTIANNDEVNPVTVAMCVDLRLLGAPRRHRTTGTF